MVFTFRLIHLVEKYEKFNSNNSLFRKSFALSIETEDDDKPNLILVIINVKSTIRE